MNIVNFNISTLRGFHPWSFPGGSLLGSFIVIFVLRFIAIAIGISVVLIVDFIVVTIVLHFLLATIDLHVSFLVKTRVILRLTHALGFPWVRVAILTVVSLTSMR